MDLTVRRAEMRERGYDELRRVVDEQKQMVAAWREAGATLEEIGSAVGVTKQAIYKHYT